MDPPHADRNRHYVKAPPPQIQRSPLFHALPESRHAVGAQSPQQSSLVGDAGMAQAMAILERRRAFNRPTTADALASRCTHRPPLSPEQQQLSPARSFQESLRLSPPPPSRMHPTSTASTTSTQLGNHSNNNKTAARSGSVASTTAAKKKKHDIYQYCGTLFMVEQATEVRAFEQQAEKDDRESAFQRERRWALLRMRQVEKDTRAQREAAHKKRLREARLLARQQQEDVFTHEKELTSHNERKERTHMETNERKDRRGLAYGMWLRATTIYFEKEFGSITTRETLDRRMFVENFLWDTEAKIRAFIIRITTSDRTSLMQHEKSERIVCMRYAAAFAAWRGAQDQQVSNLTNSERKQRYRVCDHEDISFGEIDAIKQGILSDIAREARRKQEAKLAAIREMELFYQHQRRSLDDEESAARTAVRNEDQAARNQIRLQMLDDRKAATEAANARRLLELERWKQQCWLQQQPLLREEDEARHSCRLDEGTAFRVLQMLRQQMWDDILSPLALLLGDEGVGVVAAGKKLRNELEVALRTLSDSTEGGSASTPSAAGSGPKSKQWSKLRSAVGGGSTRLQYDVPLPYGAPATQLCAGVSLRRKTDGRHYTSQPLTHVGIIVRLRGGGSPSDEVQVLSSLTTSLRDKSVATGMVLLASSAALPAAASPAKGGAKASAAAGSSDLAPVDMKALAQQLLCPSLRTVDSTVYDDDNAPLCTIESMNALPTLDNCASYADWHRARGRLEDEQKGQDGTVVLSLALMPIEKDNVRMVERVLQALVFVPGQAETVATQQRRVDIEIFFQAPPKRRSSMVPIGSAASLNATTSSNRSASPSAFQHTKGAVLSTERSMASTQGSPVTGGGGGPGLATYRLSVSIKLVPACPLLAIGSPLPMLTQIGMRDVVFHDLHRGGLAVSTGSGAKAPAVKPMSALFPSVRTGRPLLSAWWGGTLTEPAIACLSPVAVDFQGAVVRLRALEGAVPEDIVQFVPNEQFTIKRDEFKYTPPSNLASVVDPMVCARIVYGKIVPTAPTSSKDVWFAVTEAAPFWAPTATSPAFVPSFVLEGFLSRLFFSTTSGSTMRRVFEVTVVLHRKFGGASTSVRVEVGTSGNPATCCGAWVGADDPALLHQRYIDSHLPTPEHLRPFLTPDTVSMLQNLRFEPSGKVSQSCTDATLLGAGALRITVGDNPYLWDRIEVVSRSPTNTHGLLMLVSSSTALATSAASSFSGIGGKSEKLMWSMHTNDESSLVHVGSVRRIVSLEGKLRPGVVVELNESCRLGTVLAILKSLTFSTTVPPTCTGTTKSIAIELIFASDQGKAKGGGAGGGGAEQKGGKPSSPSKADNSATSPMVASTPSQLLSAVQGPMRFALQLHCTHSILANNGPDKSRVVQLPRIEPIADAALAPLSIVAAGAPVAAAANSETRAPAPFLRGGLIFGTALDYVATLDVSFDASCVEITCFPRVNTSGSGLQNASATSLMGASSSSGGAVTHAAAKCGWQVGLLTPSSTVVPRPTEDNNGIVEGTEGGEEDEQRTAPTSSDERGNANDGDPAIAQAEGTVLSATTSLSSAAGAESDGGACTSSDPLWNWRYQWGADDDGATSKSRTLYRLGDGREAAVPVATVTSTSVVESGLVPAFVPNQAPSAGEGGSDCGEPAAAHFLLGPAATSQSTLMLHLGSKKRDALGTVLVRGKQLRDILSMLVVSPMPNRVLAPPPASPAPGSGTASPTPSSPTQGAPSTSLDAALAQDVVHESVILRITIVDVFGKKHQAAVAVEITPRNLPSYFTGTPSGPLVWRSGTEGYLNDAMLLLPQGCIEDEDTEATGEGAYLRVEPLGGLGTDDKLIFHMGHLPKHLLVLPGPLNIVEFVEPLREGELRRYNVRYEGRGKGSTDVDVGTATLTYGVPNPTFCFTFCKDVPLRFCTQVLRQLCFRHSERFPLGAHTRQLLLRFNAMDDEGVVDTRHVLDVLAAPPLMYTLPLYETARLRHGDRIKQLPLFPKVLMGVAGASELGQQLLVQLDTRAQDERLAFQIEAEVRDSMFVERHGDAAYVSFHCQFAAALFTAVGAQRTASALATALGLEDLPIAPTPGFEGVVFGKILEQSDKCLRIQLADATMTRGHELLPAAAIPHVLAKLWYASDAIEPLIIPRTATVSWQQAAGSSVSIVVRVLVESGEPVATLSTSVDSLHVFPQHPRHVIPDVTLSDIALDTILGKEAEITASIIDATPSDALSIGMGGRFDDATMGHACRLDGTIKYAEDSRTISVDEEEVAWVEVGRGALANSRLTIKFSQCPASVAQYVLRRLTYASDDNSSVGRVKLLEVTMRVYQNQPAPSMLHVQLSIQAFPFHMPLGFSGRLVENRHNTRTATALCKAVQWSTSSASGNTSTLGLRVAVQLLTTVPEHGASAFQHLFDADPSSLPQPLPVQTPAFPHYDRVNITGKTLPPHLAFGGAGKTANTVVLVGRGLEVCHVEVAVDFQRVVLSFPDGRAVPYQLVLDVLGSLVYEFNENGDPAAHATDSAGGAVTDAAGQAKRKGGAKAATGPAAPTTSAAAAQPAPQISFSKGQRRFVAARIQTMVHMGKHAATAASSGGVAVGDDIVPIACTT